MPENQDLSIPLRTINLNHANTLIQRGQAVTDAAGTRAVFAGLDPGANLVAFGSSDRAWFAANDLAIPEARTSVMFQMLSGVLASPLTPGSRRPTSATSAVCCSWEGVYRSWTKTIL